MIDSHCHIWTLANSHCTWPSADLSAIHRDFAVPDLAVLARPLGVTGCVLVQSQEDAGDTEWLLDQAGANPFVLGVIGWLDLSAPDAADQVARLAPQQRLCGLRAMLQDRDPFWLQSSLAPGVPAAMTAAGLVFDALVRPQHLAALLDFARRFPELSIVIDHAAKPQAGMTREWGEDLARLAALPNVACKLSGLLTESLDGDQTRNVAEFLLESFGGDRVLWGSDWPVLNLASNYSAWLGLAQRIVPPALHPAVFRENAARLYGLPT